VVGQSPAGGTAAGVGAAVTVDRAGNGALGLALVPEVLGLPGLLRQAGLHGQATTAYDTDADAAALRPGLVGKTAPGPGGQTPLARPVEPDSLWGRTVLVDHPHGAPAIDPPLVGVDLPAQSAAAPARMAVGPYREGA
jgi:hypothetical protein